MTEEEKKPEEHKGNFIGKTILGGLAALEAAQAYKTVKRMWDNRHDNNDAEEQHESGAGDVIKGIVAVALLKVGSGLYNRLFNPSVEGLTEDEIKEKRRQRHREWAAIILIPPLACCGLGIIAWDELTSGKKVILPTNTPVPSASPTNETSFNQIIPTITPVLSETATATEIIYTNTPENTATPTETETPFPTWTKIPTETLTPLPPQGQVPKSGGMDPLLVDISLGVGSLGGLAVIETVRRRRKRN